MRGADVCVVLLAALLIAACEIQAPEQTSGSRLAERADLPERFGFGHEATPAEVQAADTDVAPDGVGLPPGDGTVAEGETVYRQLCAACHGATGTEGPSAALVGREPREGFPFGQSRQYRRTIGNYWPYATTLYDYVARAMPQATPGSLSPEEVYAVTAYLLYLNEIVPEGAVMNAETLPAIIMPARDRFVPDDRTGGPVVR